MTNAITRDDASSAEVQMSNQPDTGCEALPTRHIQRPDMLPFLFSTEITYDPPGLPLSHYQELDADDLAFISNVPGGCWRIRVRDTGGLGDLVASGWFTTQGDGILCESMVVSPHYSMHGLAKHLCDWASYHWGKEVMGYEVLIDENRAFG